jgi:hypothetical protein
MLRNSSSKKGVTLVETIAYIALYGVVMSLLATFVFVLVQSTRKVNRVSILNRGTKLLYTEFLAQAINFNADYVVVNETVNDTVSVTLEKHYRYDDEGNRIEIVAGDTEYANKPVKLTYSYKKGESKMKYTYTKLDNSETTNEIKLDYGITITSATANDNDISNIFTLVSKSNYNKSLIFNGKLNFDKKSVEFNFVIPVYVITA